MTGSSAVNPASDPVQFAPLQSAAPLEHLVRVYTVSTSHQRNTSTRLQYQLRNAPLLRHHSTPAGSMPSSHFLLISHDRIVVLQARLMPEENSGRLLLKSVEVECK
jgi:hypothetical protein